LARRSDDSVLASVSRVLDAARSSRRTGRNRPFCANTDGTVVGL
jgi:hypothetical protein